MPTLPKHVTKRVTSILAATALAAGGAAAAAPAAHASSTDSFYTYSGSKPLSDYAPGAVLNTRTISYHVLGIPLPVTAVQILYRTTNARGQAIANVTSVLKAAGSSGTQAVSYQSFYDSLNPADGPSRSIAGGLTFGGVINDAETLFIAPELLSGRSVIVTDTEGPTADFASGPEYGMTTLDGIRAATHASTTGLNTSTKVGLMGYSGGAIATDWAAALAPAYAPDVNKNLVGFAEGGLLVDPAHNLRYVSGSIGWAGIAPMALVGLARGFGIDFTPYLSSYGQQVMAKMQNASIANVLYQYPGLTWSQLVKPQYDNPDSIPAFVKVANELNLGSRPSPTIPGDIGQGADGWLDGTNGAQAGIGAGDGVMIAGDVRTLARQYCASGTKVEFTQYDLLEHLTTAAAWAPGALLWLNDRFAGKAAPSNCGSIAAGNPLTPES